MKQVRTFLKTLVLKRHVSVWVVRALIVFSVVGSLVFATATLIRHGVELRSISDRTDRVFSAVDKVSVPNGRVEECFGVFIAASNPASSDLERESLRACGLDPESVVRRIGFPWSIASVSRMVEPRQIFVAGDPGTFHFEAYVSARFLERRGSVTSVLNPRCYSVPVRIGSLLSFGLEGLPSEIPCPFFSKLSHVVRKAPSDAEAGFLRGYLIAKYGNDVSMLRRFVAADVAANPLNRGATGVELRGVERSGDVWTVVYRMAYGREWGLTEQVVLEIAETSNGYLVKGS